MQNNNEKLSAAGPSASLASDGAKMGFAIILWAAVVIVGTALIIYYSQFWGDGSDSAVVYHKCSSSNCVTRSFYYLDLDATAFLTQKCDPDDLTQTTCLNEYANVTLLDMSGKEIGNLQFVDNYQKNKLGKLFATERGNLQFTDVSYPSYISYEYPFNSPSGDFLWTVGSIHTMKSISSSIATHIYIVITVGKGRSTVEITYDPTDVTPPAVFTETKKVNYYKSELQTWTAPCRNGVSTCSIQAYNTPLYDTTSIVVGNLIAWIYVQVHGDLSFTSQYVVYQFFDNSPLKYLAYNYDFISSISNSGIYKAGSNIDVNAYATGELVAGSNPEIQCLNFPLKESLVVTEDKRDVTLSYSLVAPAFYPTITNKIVYYNKNGVTSSSAPCSQSSPNPNNCTVEVYNADLYTADGTVVGNVQFFDVLQYNGEMLLASESASYQFTADGYPDFFLYEYAFQSFTGDSEWPNGYKVNIRSVTSSYNVGYSTVALLIEVGEAVRTVTLSW